MIAVVRWWMCFTVLYCGALLCNYLVQCGSSSLGSNQEQTLDFHEKVNHNHQEIDGDTTSDLTEDIPLLIWWTEQLYPHMPGTHKKTCRLGSCYVTKQKGLKDHRTARGFLFYGSELTPQNVPLPRLPHHEWALLHEESPLNNFMLDHSLALRMFNYTATYHRDADFPLTLLSWPSTEYIMNRKPVTTAIKNDLQKHKGLAPVAYIQSHCEVPSDRDRYVQELMKYIKVDSYGKCLHNRDLPEYLTDPVESMFDNLFKDLMAEYKFHIAFENGICNDYMTEKLFRPLHLGSVPIYRGSPLAKDFMPDRHSIIMADDFASPKALAEYILHLDSNDEAYNEYLQFKQTGKIVNPFLEERLKERENLWAFTNDDDNYGPFIEHFECYFCDKLIERYSNEKLHKADSTVPLMPPKLTDGRKMACPQPQPYSNPPADDWWHLYNFPESYWQGLDQARTLRDMLIANESDISLYDKYAAKYLSPPTNKDEL